MPTIKLEHKKTLAPKLRFKGFEDTWKKEKLAALTTKISDGLHSTPLYDENGEYFFVNGNNLINGVITIAENTKRINFEEYTKHKKDLSNKTILISINGTIGSLAFYNNEKIILGKSACYINIKDEVDKVYIYNALKTSTILNFFNAELTGSTIKNLSLTTIKNCEFPIPTLPEQQKIAQFLSAVDEKIQQLTRKKQLLQQYKKGIMQQLFSGKLRFKDENGKAYPKWEEKKLGEVSKVYDGTHQTPTYVKEGIPFYSVEHVTANQFSNTKYISKEVFDKENEKVRLEKGDILMTKIGDIGTARLIDWNVEASFYVSLALIKQNKQFSSKYLAQYMASRNFQLELWKRIIHVAFPKKINLGEIGNCKILLPVMEEQKKIANFLSGIDAKIEGVTNQITQSQQFKKGLLQQLFV